MEPYRHVVQYYETDRMGVTHHSNYVRWMEEARVDFLKQSGWGYERLEEEGIVSPVMSLECRYKAPTTFPEVVFILVSVSEYSGIALKLKYTMTNAGGRKVFEGYSEHCFVNKDGKILRIERDHPALHEFLTSLREK